MTETKSLATTSIAVRAAEIRVVKGPDAGATARIEGPAFTLGKGANADLRLTDETVSREHLRFSLGPKGLLMEDGGSRNGTWLGGIRLDRALLTSDVTLTLGATLLEIRIDGAASQIAITEDSEFGEAIGVSVPMRHVFAVLEKAATSQVTVLLEGENGVGKEVLARAVHARSARADWPFVTVDCSAIPPGLIESELFGHERGAFTGADQARIGLFEQADGGTVFLDEIGELPMDLQPKLLRVLEQREIRPVGGRATKPIDVRVIAATNRNLSVRVKENEFREDLFYRLAMARVRIPSLRERPDDIVALATAFLRQATKERAAELPADLVALLKAYDWPGNVRELRNVVARYALLGYRSRRDLFDEGEAGLSRAPSAMSGDQDLSALAFHEARDLVVERFEKNYFPSVMAKAGGVVSKAAELAGVARPSFYRMLDRHGLLNRRED